MGLFMDKKIWRRGLSLLMAVWLALGTFIQPAGALTEEQKLISEVWRIVNRNYLDETFNHQNWATVRQKALEKPLKNQEAAYAAVQNMLKSLDDPFTRFLDPEQYRSLQVNTSGELTGVGLQIALDPKTGKLEVVAPIAGSPADKAGIQPRDRIIKIEGISTENLTLDEAAAKMRGPIGSLVTLLIERDGTQEQEIRVVRDRIALNPVISDLRVTPQGTPIGYLRLNQFNANASMELAHAINSLEKKGAAAYILDLRNNPGGLLQAGIEIARLWLDSGTIVYTVNRQGIQGSFEAFGPALTSDPLVILVNQGTASASEILAGALQDNGRATLVGETTFGKGLIQSLFELSDGSGLAVTIAKYETPQHRDINKLGIKPDKVIPLDTITRDQIGTEADPQYQAAVELLTNNPVVVGMGNRE
ncbi:MULTISPECIES: carboxyl-terminal processing protease CtpA [unclassified Tolypothrix]|uniref:carboxyl-terminal processing protease CtpA n=1 Tax=unclassified Tolypothrix TaxID=2649714 RepID=UPI0005EAA86B|nr:MULTISPECIES: carboxyl-terminal processing protease CtpA [unclassified Tolypothrix]BAY89039.1 carboxyl-terminal protease [Microchaete diplosiphon NIES-3275]EKF06193.1 peptidase [Tolypothrix sp. PCC 7601]MBE9086931.1 PDZ domain-containing protein [Tolypothrix sp. LEGE 11397]UYD29668.1 PDZ domain-containing protein [Tolypothrix sp. PCC 7712]UYD34416.1 PDZ domain-containing protein [Tolypothrix sp. PCC 7601]